MNDYVNQVSKVNNSYQFASKSVRNGSAENRTMVPGVGSYNVGKEYKTKSNGKTRKEVPNSVKLVSSLISKQENVPSIPLQLPYNDIVGYDVSNSNQLQKVFKDKND